MELDLRVFNFIHGFAGQYFVLDWIFIFLAKYLPYLLIIWIFFSILKVREQRERLLHAIVFGLALLFSRGIFVEVIRYFVPRERPFLALNFEPLITGLSSHSFPSGHASFFFAIAMAAALLSGYKYLRFFVFAILIGVARIYVGVHYPFDIVAGAVIGILSGFLAYKFLSGSLRRVRAQASSLAHGQNI